MNDPTPNTPFLRSDCDHNCKFAKSPSGVHHHSHSHSHDRNAVAMRTTPRLPQNQEEATSSGNRWPDNGGVALSMTPQSQSRVRISSSTTTRTTSARRLMHNSTANDVAAFARPVTPTPSTAVATPRRSTRTRHASNASNASNISQASNISHVDLERLKKALDINNPKRTDYTYSHTATYRKNTPPASVENPRLSRKTLHGGDAQLRRTFSNASKDSSLFSWHGLRGLISKFYERYRSQTGDEVTSSQTIVPVANGGFASDHVALDLNYSGFSDDDEELTYKKTTQLTEQTSTNERRGQFALFWYLVTVVTSLISTVVSIVSYPLRSLSSSSSADVGVSKSKRRRGCPWWPCWCCLLFALLPLLFFAAVGKDRSEHVANLYLLPVPLAIWNRTRDTVESVDFSAVRHYISNHLAFSSPSNLPMGLVPPSSVGVSQSEFDALSAKMDRFAQQFAILTGDCCNKDYTSFGFALQSTVDQKTNGLTTKLEAMAAKLEALIISAAKRSDTADEKLKALNQRTSQLEANLLDTSGRFTASLAVLQQSLRGLQEQIERTTDVHVKTSSDGDTKVATAEIELKIEQLSASIATVGNLVDNLTGAMREERANDAAGLEAKFAGIISQLRMDLADKQSAIAADWQGQLATILDTMNGKDEAVKNVKDQLLALEKSRGVGDQQLTALIDELKTQIESSSHGATGTAAGLSEEQLKVLIALAIARYDADKTGLADHALESAGGSVLSTRCSTTYSPWTRLESIWRIPLWYNTYSPRTVIQRPSGLTLSPGECWAFEGLPGHLVIKLSGLTTVEAFSYEHIHRSVSPDAHLESAPKALELLGLQAENDLTPISLGNYTYDIEGAPLQTFTAQVVRTVPMVELRVNSNYGHPTYTCLYRLRVHGRRELPKYGQL